MSEINIESIMKKVDQKVSDKSFLAAKLTGRRYVITCYACNREVEITVTQELTGVCPLCGHENELTFSIA